MTRHFAPPPAGAAASAAILIDAARCWRRARDTGEAIQPRLAQALAMHDCSILAPVLDSLIRFYELARGRPMAVGNAGTPSDDERLLLGLLDGSTPHACIDCLEDAATMLDCALCSARIMLALAQQPSAVLGAAMSGPFHVRRA
jgi:hypothetical protein